jgi:hypothetical protein
MNKLKKDTSEYIDLIMIYEEFDKIAEGKYEGVSVMTEYFNDNLRINEIAFAKVFNKTMESLLSYSRNLDAIMEQIPSQFQFGDEFKKKFIRLLPANEDEILNVIKEWNKETALLFSSKETKNRTLEDIYLISFPYTYLALTVKDEELSMNILFMLNLLMYTMAYSWTFPKYHPNKDKGQYVIQNLLKNKGYAKYNSIHDLMIKLSRDTRATYAGRVSDRIIYEVSWSNIQTKMKYYTSQFRDFYQSVGSVYLNTNKDILSTSDREGNDTTVETNIENNSSVILRLAKEVTNYISNPTYIEYSLIRMVLNRMLGIDINIKKGNVLEKKSLIERNLYSMIEEIQKTQDFEIILSNVLQNFLWSEDKTSIRDIETPKFLDKIIYDLSYIGKNKIYINNIIETLDKYIDIVLENRGKTTDSIDNKTLQRYRKAIIYYFALLIQFVTKRN